jgi:hypothetical protein
VAVPYPSGDPKAEHDGLEAQRVMALSGDGHPAQWPAGGVGREVNLRCQATARTTQRLPIPINAELDGESLVIRCRPLRATPSQG